VVVISAAMLHRVSEPSRIGNQLFYRRLQRLGAPRHQDHIHALAHQCLRATETQTLAGATH
jgi:hypothetical protein